MGVAWAEATPCRGASSNRGTERVRTMPVPLGTGGCRRPAVSSRLEGDTRPSVYLAGGVTLWWDMYSAVHPGSSSRLDTSIHAAADWVFDRLVDGLIA
jgi:hypothetical protein